MYNTSSTYNGSIGKISDLDKLAHTLASYRSEGKKIVLCHGVFDLLHIGHIRYFEQAKRLGDILVVTITPDDHVDKGPGRPAFTEKLRAEAIASLSCVDHVAVNKWATAEETLRLLKPDFYVKGSEFKDTASDMTGKIGKEETVSREIGATLAFIEDIVFSSTHLINRYLSGLPEAIQQYLSVFSQRYEYQEILDALDQMASLNVLVIGDTILDEYQYVQTIGKSSKDPILAVQYQSHDLFAGGVLAIANHVANYAKHVQLVTVLGERDRHEDFIRSQLSSTISPHFIIQPNAPTLIKRRFIDGYTFNKLFEVYVMDDRGLPPEEETGICEWLEEELPKYDVVIAADFGHGGISAGMVRCLAKNVKFLAVSTQANAGNRGFHTVTRYPRADLVCLAEHEMRLEMRDLTGDLRPMMLDLSRKLGCPRIIVTAGRKGCRMLGTDGVFVEVPSFTEKVVDRVGAGDAFYSVTSLAAAMNVPDEIVSFIGNMAGSLAVEILGNQKSIDKMALKKYAVSLLK